MLFLYLIFFYFDWLFLLGFTLSVLFVFLFFKAKKLQFDENNFYKINGKKEIQIPFSSITGIKITTMKINHKRVWRLIYVDDSGTEKKLRMREGTFQHGSINELITASTKVNSEIRIWTDPFFKDPIDKKKK